MVAMRRTIVDEVVSSLVGDVADNLDDAFLKFSYSLITGDGYGDLSDDELVDGGQDKQIDVVHITEFPENGTAVIDLIQAKNSPSFSSNVIIEIRNGVRWLLSRKMSEVEKISNYQFVEAARRLRKLRVETGSARLTLRVTYATTGSTATLSDECKQEIRAFYDEFPCSEFQDLEFRCWGIDELVKRKNELESAAKKIDYDLPLYKLSGTAPWIDFEQGGVKAAVCSVKGTEIAELLADDRDISIFDANVRGFLENKGSVNNAIKKTCTSDSEASKFWFFNNGLTMICDNLDFVRDPDAPKLKLKNIQIVNGCQTATTIKKAHDEGTLKQDVTVLVKVFESTDSRFVGRIVNTTNSQNAIGSRDLAANDPRQNDIQSALQDKYGVLYERKRNQYVGLNKAQRDMVVNNERAGQAYLAIVGKRPTVARTQKYKIWSQFYDEAFPTADISVLYLATLIYGKCNAKRTALMKSSKSGTVAYGAANYGVFHLARATAYYWTGKEHWNETQAEIFVEEIKTDTSKFDEAFMTAYSLLTKIIESSAEYREDPDNALKRNEIDNNITTALHDRRRGKPVER